MPATVGVNAIDEYPVVAVEATVVGSSEARLSTDVAPLYVKLPVPVVFAVNAREVPNWLDPFADGRPAVIATFPAVGYEVKAPLNVSEVVVSDVAAVKPKFTITAAETTGVVVAWVNVTAVIAPAEYAAFAGATEVKTPKPIEATATSAMRLKVVFVDICFLSISRLSDDPSAGFG